MKTAERLVPELRFPGFDGEWHRSRFNEVVVLKRGSSPRPIIQYLTKKTEGVNWIKIGDTKGEKNIITKTKEKITLKGAEKSRYVKKGEIILSNSMSYGKPYILEINGYIHDGWFVLRNYESYLDKIYLIQTLISELIQRQYKRLAAGGVVNNISSELVNSVLINFPSLPEQQKIASFLSAVDKKIEKLTRKKELLQTYKKGLMQKIFSRQIRFKDNVGNNFPDWEEKRLGEVGKIYDGTHNTPNYQPTGIPFYSVEHITKGDFSKTKFISEEVYLKENKRVKLEKGDILMTRIGDVGTSVLLDWDVKASFYVSLALIKGSKDFNSGYLNQYIKSDLFQRSLWGKMIHVAFPKKINLGEIGMCSVLLPCIKEQQKIANFLSSIDNKINAVDKQLSQTQTFKKGLLQKMFV